VQSISVSVHHMNRGNKPTQHSGKLQLKEKVPSLNAVLCPNFLEVKVKISRGLV